MTSVLNVDTIADKAGTGPVALTKQSAAKGWMKYDQYNNNVDDSVNVSSATDAATGNFRQNHINSMSNANYSSIAMSGTFRVFVTNGEGNSGGDNVDTTSLAYFEVVYNSTGSTYAYIDMASNGTAIHGDLA